MRLSYLRPYSLVVPCYYPVIGTRSWGFEVRLTISSADARLGYARAVMAVSRWLDPWMRNRLFRKYVVPFVAVVSGALLTNGLLEIYFTYQESRAQLAQIGRRAQGIERRLSPYN